MKVFSVRGYFQDSPTEQVEGFLIAEANSRPRGYQEEQIFFYGLSEETLKQIIKDKEPVGDLIVTGYEVDNMTIKEKTRTEAEQQIKNRITPKGTILIVVKSVSQSGLTRRMKVLNNKFEDLSYWVASLCDLPINDDGLMVKGCGMDMGFWLADRITKDLDWSDLKVLNGNGGKCIAWRLI